MSLEQIGSGFRQLTNDDKQSFDFVIVNRKLWLFTRNRINQPTYNWGKSVISNGGYAIAFDLDTNEWGPKIDYPELEPEENALDLLFTLGDRIFLVILPAFAKVSFDRLFEWTGTEWVELSDYEKPEALQTDGEPMNAYYVEPNRVLGNSSDKRFIIVNFNGGTHLFKFTNVGGFKFEKVGEIADDGLGSICLQAIDTGSRILMDILVKRMCPCSWARDRVVAYDYNTDETSFLGIEGEESPRWGYSGPSTTELADGGRWIHATGSIQVGQCDSKYEGSVWILNVEGHPKWEKTDLVIPEDKSGHLVIDSTDGSIYVIRDDSVLKATL